MERQKQNTTVFISLSDSRADVTKRKTKRNETKLIKTKIWPGPLRQGGQLEIPLFISMLPVLEIIAEGVEPDSLVP